jgi:hypothetical protein
MNFQQSLNAHFPNAFTESDFVKRSYDALFSYGFNDENSIACVSVCRDEITRSLVDNVQKVWGEAFNFSSLGGMLFLGKTGFSAAHHHAPVYNGREHYVYFAMAHIAIDSHGEVGVCYRPGRSAPSGACGALIAFREEMVNGDLDMKLDMDDVEQSLLKHRLLRKIRYGDVPELASLTKIAHSVILDDLEHMVKLTVDPSVSDYAILSGIQIHGPNREQFIWPGERYVVKNGKRSTLELGEKSISK